MNAGSPSTCDQLIAEFEAQETASVAYWDSFDTERFFSRIGDSWSPAETVRHLSKSTRPVVKALRMPSVVVRLMFGRAKRPSMTFDEFRRRYLDALAEGGRAGRFAPSSQSEADLAAWRRTIMSTYVGLLRDLRRAIARWPEKKLDVLQLPHPLLGKLTLREMLFFTLYHQRHHVDVVKRRLEEQRAHSGDRGA